MLEQKIWKKHNQIKSTMQLKIDLESNFENSNNVLLLNNYQLIKKLSTRTAIIGKDRFTHTFIQQHVYSTILYRLTCSQNQNCATKFRNLNDTTQLFE